MTDPGVSTTLKLQAVEDLVEVFTPLYLFADRPDPKMKAAVRARFEAEIRDWSGRLNLPRAYGFEWDLLQRRVRGAITGVANHLQKSGPERSYLAGMYESIREGVLMFPDQAVETVFPAQSPFKFYLWFRAACEMAIRRILILDPYATADVFHRFLNGVPAGVEVVVVVDQPKLGDKRWERLLSVSRVFAGERPTKYSLRNTPLHDRHLVVDDRGHHLGASAKDGASAADTTVTPFDDVRRLEAIVSAATEVFGRVRTTHP